MRERERWTARNKERVKKTNSSKRYSSDVCVNLLSETKTLAEDASK